MNLYYLDSSALVKRYYREDGTEFIQLRFRLEVREIFGLCLPFGQGTLVLWEESMDLKERIEVNPKVMMGKPVIKGTRIPVELILRKLSEGATEQDLLDAYPHLSHEDILAALAYAAEALAFEETIAL